MLLSDKRFAASDTLATSYVLGMGIRKIGKFDLILCGMRTTDGDTGQVGPQLAEELDLPYISASEKVEKEKSLFRVERVSDGFREILEGVGTCTADYRFKNRGASSRLDRHPGRLHPILHRMLEFGGLERRS